MVVLNHLQFYQSKTFPVQSLLPAWMNCGESGVDVFFIISGFIMTYSTPRPFTTWRDQLSFLIRRFLRIYPAYWAVLLPILVLWWFHPAYFNTSQGNRVDFPSSLFLLPSFTITILGVAWTLIFEIYFYCVVSFIFYCGTAGRLFWAGAWAAAVVIRNVVHPQWFDLACWTTWLSPLTLEFIVGIYLAYALRSAQLRLPTVVGTALILASALWAWHFGALHGRFTGGGDQLPRLYIYGLPAMVVVWVVLKLETQHELKGARNLVWLGDRSYSTYLIHLPVLTTVLYLAAKWLKDPSPYTVMAVTFAAMLLIIIPMEICYRFVEKPSHLLAKRLANKVRGRKEHRSAFRDKVLS